MLPMKGRLRVAGRLGFLIRCRWPSRGDGLRFEEKQSDTASSDIKPSLLGGLANGAHWPSDMMGLPVVVLRLGGGAGLSDSETRASSL